MNMNQAIARYGTQQYERLAAQLSAEYVSIEERSVEQQLALMQQLAAHIRYFDLDNQDAGDWQGLFEADPAEMLAYLANPTDFAVEADAPLSLQREQQDRLSYLSQPQRVLVGIFLRMSQAVRARFATLTQQHLDFYYRDVLQMSPAKGQADYVHLIAKSPSNSAGTTLTKGTLFNAGNDADGNPIQFALDANYQVNQAQLSEVKSVRVNRHYISLNQLRQTYQNGFEVALRWALGQYFQGDVLPSFPKGRYFDQAVDLAFLVDRFLFNPVEQGYTREFQDYIVNLLGFVDVGDFDSALDVHVRSMAKTDLDILFQYKLTQHIEGSVFPRYGTQAGGNIPQTIDLAFLLNRYQTFGEGGTSNDVAQKQDYINYVLHQLGFTDVAVFEGYMSLYQAAVGWSNTFPDESEWIVAMSKVEAAFTKRYQQDQMQNLLTQYLPSTKGEKGQLQVLFEYIFGDPQPGDRLPAMPSTSDTLETLYHQLKDDPKNLKDSTKLVARYLSKLDLSVADYLFIYERHLTSASLYGLPISQILDVTQAPETSWYRFFYKLQRIEFSRRNKQTPRPGRYDVKHIVAEENATLDGSNPAFGRLDVAVGSDKYYGPGLAVVSPLLHLAEGERRIRVEVACQQADFPLDDLQLAKDQGTLHFDLRLSGDDGWQTLNTQTHGEQVSYSIQNIGNDLVAAHSPEALLVLTNLPVSAVNIKNGDSVVWDDGSIWQVYNATSTQLQLIYLSKVEGLSNQQFWHVPQLAFTQSTSPLTTLTYAPVKQEVSLAPADGGFGSAGEIIEQGDYVILHSGEVLSVTEILPDNLTAKVTLLGVLPASMMSSINGSSNASTHHRITSLTLRDRSIVGDIVPQGLVGRSAANSDSNNSANDKLLFSGRDLNRMLRFPSGLNLSIRQLVEPTDGTDDNDPEKPFAQALVNIQPTTEADFDDPRIKKFSTYPGFVFDIHLDSTLPAVTPAPASEAVPGFAPIEPVLQIKLANIVDTTQAQEAVDIAYEYFSHVRLHNVRVHVDVRGLTQLQLANDDTLLAAEQPFQPFGSQPYAGSSLYFSHYELARKKLSNIRLNMEWVDLPENLGQHYQAYRDAYPDQVPALSNSAYQVKMSLFNQRSFIEQEQDLLLLNTDAQNTSHIEVEHGFAHSSYQFLPRYSTVAPASPLDSERYFKLTLNNPDFQHKLYPHVVRKLSLQASKSEGAELPLINEPYTPQVRSFSVDYQAEEVLTPDIYDTDEHSLLAHLHPFGGINVNQTINPNRLELGASLLPQFDDEGYLYLGLEKANPQDEINLLVQVVSGTGKANLSTPALHWYYRSEQGLKALPSENLLDDTTRSMSFSGLIRVRLPDDIALNGPLLPQGKHWLVAQVLNNADSAARIEAITPQAMRANRVTPISANTDPILSAGSVQGLVNANGKISSVEQPYASVSGRAEASDTAFYRDVSERLRHRNRAVTLWDYERLLLARFAQIRQVKCLADNELPSAEPGVSGSQATQQAPGAVTLVVLPEMKGQPIDNVLKPAVSPDLLTQIQTELSRVAPPQVQLNVINPVHEEIRFRVAVRFNQGFGPGIYQTHVVEAIKALLTPWVDAQAEPIQMGNRFYFSEVIDHLERQEYVDYVANLTCFKRVTLNAGTDEERQVWEPVLGGSVRVDRPDAMLVSSDFHRVDVIASEHFDPEDYQGVGYMVVELDNIVQ
ncbi:hypothetical protein [Alteromonas sp. a30]|uniref:hypothetical protein n=1 Tax=Alteromonas sp. a30 TaxID=2730917 RepID=UPI0022821B5F|nr:hypothetical protein [Alteromonas sp. a30]MCY7294207.1 hypothetical protein [Alteromonas sp. a30]